MGVIKQEMTEIRDKFADERRTELTVMEGEIDIEDLIQSDDMVVTMTHFGYVKRLPKSTYRAQHRGGKGVSGMATREEDFAERLIIVNTHDEIMFFTNPRPRLQPQVLPDPRSGTDGARHGPLSTCCRLRAMKR